MRINVNPVLNAGEQAQFLVIDSHQLENGEQRVATFLVQGTARLLAVKFATALVEQLRKRGLDIHHVANQPGFDHYHQVVERRAVRRLVRFHQHEAMFLGILVEFLRLVLLQDHGRFAKHVFPRFQRLLDAFIVRKVRSRDIYGGNPGKQFVVRLAASAIGQVVLAEFPRDFDIGIVCGNDAHAIHHVGFLREALGNTAAANNADRHRFLVLVAQLRRGNAFRAGQVHDIAEFIEVIELAFPIGTYREDIDIVFLDIVNFLPDIVLDNHQVGKARSTHGFDTFEHVVADIQLSAFAVEIVVGNPDNQVVTEFLRPTQQVDMPLV